MRHIKTHMSAGDQEYHCGDCDIQFNSLFAFKTHRKECHQTNRHTQTGRGKKPEEKLTSGPFQPSSGARQEDGQFTRDPDQMPAEYFNGELLENQHQVYKEHWKQIMTKHSRNNKLQDRYNFRLTNLSPGQLAAYLRKIFNDQKYTFKLNFSFGFLLRENGTDNYKYYHSSLNNHRFLDEPLLITNEHDLVHFIDTQLQNINVLEWARLQRPNSKWVVDLITNVTFFISKLNDHPIGAAVKLPKFIAKNKSIVALHRDGQTGRYYDDNLCLFRCLAIHSGCHSKNLRKTTECYFDEYLKQTGQSKGDFQGVSLDQLSVVEIVSNKYFCV